MKLSSFVEGNTADTINAIIGTTLFAGACILPGVLVWKLTSYPSLGFFGGLGVLLCMVLFYGRPNAPDSFCPMMVLINIASLTLLFAMGIFTLPEWLPLPDSWYWAH